MERVSFKRSFDIVSRLFELMSNEEALHRAAQEQCDKSFVLGRLMGTPFPFALRANFVSAFSLTFWSGFLCFVWEAFIVLQLSVGSPSLVTFYWSATPLRSVLKMNLTDGVGLLASTTGYGSGIPPEC